MYDSEDDSEDQGEILPSYEGQKQKLNNKD